MDLLVLIVQDNAYGMIRWKQAIDAFADLGLTLGNPNFAKDAESYGAKGWQVDTADALVPTLEAAFKKEASISLRWRSTIRRTGGF